MSDRLSEIRARLDKATPGPWEVVGYGTSGVTIAHPNEGYHDLNVLKTTDDWPPNAADAELIAHAPEDIQWLAGEVERLRVLLSERDQEIRVKDRERALLSQPALDLGVES
jgi:hypothetical protein